MTTQNVDLQAPLPRGQYKHFIYFFHTCFAVAIVQTSYRYWKRFDGRPGADDLLMLALVTVQVFLYAAMFYGNRRPPLRLIVASAIVGVVAVSIFPGFWWVLLICVALLAIYPGIYPLGGAIAIVAAYVQIRTGWLPPSQWGAGVIIQTLLSSVPMFGMAFFMGRAVQTSEDRGQVLIELETAKRKLVDAHRQQLELAALRERERLARDLHDSLGHSLVTMTVQLEAARQLQATDPAKAAAVLADLQSLTRSSMDDLRRSLENLRARGLENRPLSVALQALCDDVQKRLPASTCAIPPGIDSLTPAVADALWRTAQEGLMNIERHASASAADMTILLEKNAVTLRISDDGAGFPGGGEKAGRYGLIGLRERLEGIGGTLTVSSPARGTLLEARVPLIA